MRDTAAVSSLLAWAWAAFTTWLLTAVVVALRPRSSIGALDLTMIAGTLLFAGWFALSATWSRSVPSTLDESTRYLAYAGIVAAALVLVERSTVPHLLGGVTTAITLLSDVRLGTRLLPDRLGDFESTAGSRLVGTIGYWNGLGIFAVMGLFLALGFAARGERLGDARRRAAALPFLAATMYLTFSRGAWVALVAGFAAALAYRSPPAAARSGERSARAGLRLGVLLASERRTDAIGRITRVRCPERPPLRLALIVLGTLSASACAAVLWLAERRVRVPSSLRVAWAAALVACVLVGNHRSCGNGRIAGPSRPAGMGKGAGRSSRNGNNRRLFDLVVERAAGLWQVAWDTFSDHRVVGVGGGTYWQQWAASRRGFFPSREAHNVYVETLAELGIIGLVRAAPRSGPPVIGAVRARHSPLVPFAFAASPAGVVHAGVDWDWELMGVSGAALPAAWLSSRPGVETRARSLRGARRRIVLATCC